MFSPFNAGSNNKLDTSTKNEATGLPVGETFTKSDYMSDSFAVFSKVRANRKFCDFILVVKGDSIPVHKLLLAAASPFFDSMFSGSLKEKDAGSLRFEDIKPEILKQIVDFIYSGKITVTERNVQDLFSASILFQIEWITDVCCDFWKCRLHPLNCLGVRKLADAYNCKELYNRCQDYIHKNYLKLINTEEHSLLSYEEIKELVSSDEIIIDSEKSVFDAVLKWTKHNPEKRLTHFADLMSYVRFPLINAKSLMNNVANEPFIRNDARCKDFLIEAMRYHLVPEERHMLTSDRTQKRKPSGMQPHVILAGGMHSVECRMYNEFFNNAISMAPMRHRKLHAGVTASHNLLFVIGGKDRHNYATKTGQSYNPLNNTWTDIPSMAVKHYNFGICSVNGLIYACGGHDGAAVHNYVESYDILTSKWSSCPVMISKSENVRAAILDNCIYCIGNVGSETNLERYDPREGLWYAMSSLANYRKCSDVVAHGKYLYCLGGLNHNNQTESSGERFEVRHNKWQPMPPMFIARHSHSLVEIDGVIYILGGENNNLATTKVERYDINHNEWSTMEFANVKHVSGGAAVVCIL
uniref:Kelch-like protein diablo n=1 Tax=Glossina austeni TaxID=7395 RepID=A0A1A9V6G7_GLOAU